MYDMDMRLWDMMAGALDLAHEFAVKYMGFLCLLVHSYCPYQSRHCLCFLHCMWRIDRQGG